MIPERLLNSLPSALAVLTSMITPALLISACGTFILSTSNRLGRVIDRVRVLSEKVDHLMEQGPQVPLFEERRSLYFEQIERQSTRAHLLQRSLTVFYVASGMFVATSVALGVVSLLSLKFAWLPVAFGIAGACFLFWGSVLLIMEARLAISSLRAETEFLNRLVSFHAQPSAGRLK